MFFGLIFVIIVGIILIAIIGGMAIAASVFIYLIVSGLKSLLKRRDKNNETRHDSKNT